MEIKSKRNRVKMYRRNKSKNKVGFRMFLKEYNNRMQGIFRM